MTFPWTAMEPASAQARASLRRLSTSIVVARSLAISGRSIDLGGLETLTGLLCAQLMDLHPADGLAIRPELVTLDHDVQGLMDTIRSALQ